ncbi:hypothetical protein [Gorillibacterium sp. sgz5001074]|uniref:hypothetical protein n=1 Tax=Gorillibacterium sp. sgz5001074 TaxID=3446695 RepID=UPI003F67CD29
MERNAAVMAKGSRWSVYSLISAAAVIILHSIHWLLLPVLLGTATEMAHHHHHGSGSSNGWLPAALIAAVWVANVLGAYFAVRQLTAAWRGRDRRSAGTYVCCAISVGVLAVAAVSAVLSLG